MQICGQNFNCKVAVQGVTHFAMGTSCSLDTPASSDSQAHPSGLLILSEDQPHSLERQECHPLMSVGNSAPLRGDNTQCECREKGQRRQGKPSGWPQCQQGKEGQGWSSRASRCLHTSDSLGLAWGEAAFRFKQIMGSNHAQEADKRKIDDEAGEVTEKRTDPKEAKVLSFYVASKALAGDE